MLDIPDQFPGSSLTSEQFNSLVKAVENAILTSGQTLDGGNNFQNATAMASYAAVSNSYIDSGIVNAYVLSPNAPFVTPDIYRNSMSIRFIVGVTNTGATTVAVGTLGTVPFKKDNGVNELQAGDLVAGREVWGTFNSASGGFFNLVAFLSQNLVQVFARAIWTWDRPTPTTPVPIGFAICDGNNGTPDLRAKFIVMEGTGFAFGSTGGAVEADTDDAPNHTHTITVDGQSLTIAQLPAHNFSVTGRNEVVGSGAETGTMMRVNGATDTQIGVDTNTLGSGQAHAHTGSSAPAGIHKHKVPTLPPFHTLVFIMKL